MKKLIALGPQILSCKYFRSKIHLYCFFIKTVYTIIGSRGYSGAPFGPGRGPIHLGDVRCTGSEHRLIDCPYTNNTFANGSDYTHGEDVAVYCQPSTAT